MNAVYSNLIMQFPLVPASGQIIAGDGCELAVIARSVSDEAIPFAGAVSIHQIMSSSLTSDRTELAYYQARIFAALESLGGLSRATKRFASEAPAIHLQLRKDRNAVDGVLVPYFLDNSKNDTTNANNRILTAGDGTSNRVTIIDKDRYGQEFETIFEFVNIDGQNEPVLPPEDLLKMKRGEGLSPKGIGFLARRLKNNKANEASNDAWKLFKEANALERGDLKDFTKSCLHGIDEDIVANTDNIMIWLQKLWSLGITGGQTNRLPHHHHGHLCSKLAIAYLYPRFEYAKIAAKWLQIASALYSEIECDIINRLDSVGPNYEIEDIEVLWRLAHQVDELATSVLKKDYDVASAIADLVISDYLPNAEKYIIMCEDGVKILRTELETDIKKLLTDSSAESQESEFDKSGSGLTI